MAPPAPDTPPTSGTGRGGLVLPRPPAAAVPPLSRKQTNKSRRFHRRNNAGLGLDWCGQRRTRICRRNASNGDTVAANATSASSFPATATGGGRGGGGGGGGGKLPMLPALPSGVAITTTALPPSPLSPNRQLRQKRVVRQLFGRRDSGCVESPERLTASSPFESLFGDPDQALAEGGQKTRRASWRSQDGGHEEKRSRPATSAEPLGKSTMWSPESAIFMLDDLGSTACHGSGVLSARSPTPDKHDMALPAAGGWDVVVRPQPGQSQGVAAPCRQLLTFPSAWPPLRPIAVPPPAPVEDGSAAEPVFSPVSIASISSTTFADTGGGGIGGVTPTNVPGLPARKASLPIKISKPRGRSASLQERRRGKQLSMSFSLPTNVALDEDIRPDCPTEAQRDLLFTKAAEIAQAVRRSGSITSIASIASLDSLDSPLRPVSDGGQHSDEADWAAAELNSFICGLTLEHSGEGAFD